MFGKKPAKKAKKTVKQAKKPLKGKGRLIISKKAAKPSRSSKEPKPKKQTPKAPKPYKKPAKPTKPAKSNKPAKKKLKPSVKPKPTAKPSAPKSKPSAKPAAKPAAKSVSKPSSAKPSTKPAGEGVGKAAEGKGEVTEASIEQHVDDIIQKIKGLEIQGANDIAEAGVKALKYVAEKSPATSRKAFLEDLTGAAEKIMQARPTEPALRNAISNITNSAEQYELKTIENIRRYAIRRCETFLKELIEVVETISKIGAEEIRDGDIILTHCHSEHVVAILKKAKEKRRQFKVIVTETRPLKQGIMTAKELASSGIDVTYIIDSAAATVMKQATKMLVGADAILADGSIVNKIGTYAMALLAKQFQTPVFVAAETLKFDPTTIMGAAEPIEERKPDEIIEPQEIKGAKIQNPVYDVTPADLIAALITEKGVMRPELIRENVKDII